MNTHTIKLYSLNYSELKTYLFAALFIIGNLILPQLCHLVPLGGKVLLPIYFFTLISAYKYGFKVGILTAVLSPVLNSLLFGMPTIAVLPAILAKSVLLAGAAAYFAGKNKKISLLAILLTIITYQIIGTGVEWVIMGDFFLAIQDFRIAIPGLIIQLFGGYFLLRTISKI